MSFPPYGKYVTTGIPWLGRIPEGWNHEAGRRLFAQRRDRAKEGDVQLSATQKYGVIPQSLFMDAEDQKVTLALAGTDNFKHVEMGDFVISLRSFQGGIEYSKYTGCVSPAYTVLRATRGLVSAYWSYVLKSDGYISALQAEISGIRDGKNISYEQFGRIPLPLPPLAEQSDIASFLDRETAKIDALAAEQERLIALMKEKRQAVISHAVTKGLNPDAPMKDSGIEWLGKVPAHWEVTRLKYVTDLIVDCPHETPIYDDGGDFLVIRTADLESGVLDPEQMYRLDSEQYESRTRRQKLLANDIVYAREGERWGHAACIPDSHRYCLGQRMMQFRSARGTCAKYLMWQLNSTATYRQGEVDTVGATSPHVNVGTIRNFRLAMPQIEEQLRTSQHLDTLALELDELIAEAQRAVTLLNERRSALVSAAVTGQIDVRQVVAGEVA